MSKTAPFEAVDFNQERIHRLVPNASAFCEMWRSYLAGCGWTEEEYERELDRRIFISDN